jgi:DNA invertase Pin-like site-specific DNA recombinase
LLNENEWREVFAMMKLGYARVSTNEQDTAAQVSALKSAGCEKIFREKASGGRRDRPELIRLLDQLRNGDILIVSRLDRLSRSLRDLLMIMERIKEAEAGFRSLTEAIDTTSAPGRMMMQMVGAFAEFERAILRERTKTGLDAARKRGSIGGRRPKLRPDQQDEILAMVSAGTKTAADAARAFQCSSSDRVAHIGLEPVPEISRRRCNPFSSGAATG